MKRSFFLVAMACLLSIKVQAQWTASGSDIYNSNVGNVGIGNATPTSKLDVNGSINLSAGNRITIGASNALHANGTNNIAVGKLAGNSITTGQGNAFIGTEAGKVLTTGNFNSFIGYFAGISTTTGSFNSFIGNQAARFNTTGEFNVCIGSQAGYLGLSGTRNVFIGYQAGYTNTASENNFVGFKAGELSTTGLRNAFFGSRSGGTNTTGSNNSFFGTQAGQSNTTGTSNTYVGYLAQGSPTLANATAIGANATVSTNNSLVLGNNANVGIGNTAPSQRLHVTGSARITGAILDSNNDPGTAGQVLSSTVTGTDWVAAPAGPVGPTGATGAIGSVGPTGPTGPAGVDGAAGPTGATGAAGLNGATGSAGSDGATGSVGPTGPTGATGTAGLNGTVGPTGATGPLVAGTSGQTLRNNGSTWVANSTLYNDGTNVGIDTSTPSQKLHVSGNARLTGALYDGSNSAGSTDYVLTSQSSNTQWKDVCDIVAECSNLAATVGWGEDSVAVKSGLGESAMLVNMNSVVSRIEGEGALVFSSKSVGFSNQESATRMTFMPSMSSFRAGFDDQDNWNPLYQGKGSTSFGWNTLASGNYSSAAGLESRAEGQGSVAFGYQNTSDGNYATSFGYGNNAVGYATTAFGHENYAYGDFSHTSGTNNYALTYGETVIGTFATLQQGSSNTFSSNDRAFAIGIGQNADQRANALVVMKSGNTGIGTSNPDNLLDIRGNTTSTANVCDVNVNYVGTLDVRAINAQSNPTAGYGFGVVASGGYHGVSANNSSGSYAGDSYGVAGYSNGNAGSRYGLYGRATNSNGYVAYGVYGNAFGATSSYAGYFSGSVYTTGTYQPSDARLKKSVETLGNANELLSKLKVHTYEYQTEKYPTMALQEGRRFGFMADEMKEVLPQLVKRTMQPLNEPNDEQGNRQEVKYLEFDAVNYTELVPIVVQAVQELNAKVDKMQPIEVLALKTELAEVKAENAEIKNQLAEILSRLNAFDTDLQSCCFEHGAATGTSNPQTTGDNPKLEQNIPNPFRENTTIKYYLPSNSRTATITISDMNGVQLKQFDLVGTRGFGQVLISGGAFAAGTYVYTLTVDGKVVDSKRMVLL